MKQVQKCGECGSGTASRCASSAKISSFLFSRRFSQVRGRLPLVEQPKFTRWRDLESRYFFPDQMLDASRARVNGLLENGDCAGAIGAESSQDALGKLAATTTMYDDLGALRIRRNPDGTAGNPLDGSGNLAEYPTTGGAILLNSAVNWLNPNIQIALDQDGNDFGFNLLTREKNALGVESMSPGQFMDFVMLHELSHAFRVPNGIGIDRGIWERCFPQ